LTKSDFDIWGRPTNLFPICLSSSPGINGRVLFRQCFRPSGKESMISSQRGHRLNDFAPITDPPIDAFRPLSNAPVERSLLRANDQGETQSCTFGNKEPFYVLRSIISSTTAILSSSACILLIAIMKSIVSKLIETPSCGNESKSFE
jgi:hypothetical protein